MAFNNSYTAVTGGTLSASQWNTYVRDNFTSIWQYTTAGDILYATSSSSLARLGAPTYDSLMMFDVSSVAPAWLQAGAADAYKYLRQNSSGDGFEWVGGGIKVYSVLNATPYSYSSSTERNAPSSSVSITVDTQSTVVILGGITIYASTGGKGAFIITNLDGTNYSGKTEAASVTKQTNALYGIFTGVSPGTITAKLREVAEFNGNSYTVVSFYFVVLVIPE